MLGSLTTPGRPATHDTATGRVAFQIGNAVGTRENAAFVAQWPACTIPCRRFALHLAEHNARLGASVTRWVFAVADFHLLLLVGLPTHYQPALRSTLPQATKSGLLNEMPDQMRVGLNAGWYKSIG